MKGLFDYLTLSKGQYESYMLNYIESTLGNIANNGQIKVLIYQAMTKL
jgi:hypothetical protein